MYSLFMSSSISRTEKRGRGRPRLNATSIHLTLQPDLLAALDRYIAEEPPPQPSRPEAVRVLLKDQLIALGTLPAPEESEGNGAGHE